MIFQLCNCLILVGDKPIYPCQLCPTTCGRKTDLRIHIQKLHTSDKPLKCKRCGKSFPDRYNYKMHNKVIHFVYSCIIVGSRQQLHAVHKGWRAMPTQINVCSFTCNICIPDSWGREVLQVWYVPVRLHLPAPSQLSHAYSHWWETFCLWKVWSDI